MRDVDDEEETLVMPDGKADAAIDVTSKLAPAMDAMAPRSDFDSGRFRTRYADSAVSLSEQFALLVGGKPVRGAVQYRIELSTPDGPSTGGGAQVLQHIKLVPNDGGATLVAGSVHLIERTAELRTLAYLDAEHARRFSRSSLSPPPPPSSRIEATNYEELVDRLRNFCVEQDFKVTTAQLPRGAPTVVRVKERSTEPSGLSRWALPVALLAFVGTIVLVFLSLRAP